jgi:hypothetical protein
MKLPKLSLASWLMIIALLCVAAALGMAALDMRR